MAPSKAKEETRESWYGVQDPKKRKQIQDRLAQRARRKRLAEASENKDRTLVIWRGSGERSRNAVASECAPNPSSSTAMRSVPSISSSSYTTQPVSYLPLCQPGLLIIPPSVRSRSSSPLPVDHRSLTTPNGSAIAALGENGLRLGLACGCVGLVRSPRQAPDVPETLHPTPLQLTTPHPIWIDRLPFPRMRDNMIILANAINLEEFFVDVFMKPSIYVKEGMASHDPMAYRLCPEFRAKWGYLFF